MFLRLRMVSTLILALACCTKAGWAAERDAIRKARALIHERAYSAAIAALDELVSQDAADAEVYSTLGESHLGAREYESAVKFFSLAIEMSPADLATCYTKRGIALNGLRRPEEALLDFDAAIRIDPKGSMPYAYRAAYFSWKGDLSSATADFDKAIVLDAKNARALRNRAQMHLKLENYTAAIRDINAAIAIDPDDADSYTLRSSIKLEINEFDGAIEDSHLAVALEPRHGRHHRVLARGLFGAERYSEALSAAENAIRLDADDRQALEIRASAYAMLGREREALNAFHESALKTPATAGEHVAKAHLLMLGHGVVASSSDEDVKLLLSDGIGLDAEYSPAYRYRAVVNYRLQRFTDSLDDWAISTWLDGDVPPLQEEFLAKETSSVAGLDARLDELLDKVEPAERALKLLEVPGDERSRTRYAGAATVLLLLAGDHEKGVSVCNDLVTDCPQEFRAWAVRGTARYLLGDFNAAINDLDVAIKLNPQHQTSYCIRGLSRYLSTHETAGACRDFDAALQLDRQCVLAHVAKGAVLGWSGDQKQAAEFDQAAKDLDERRSTRLRAAMESHRKRLHAARR